MPAEIKTAKIVGAAGELSWSQNHIFSPEDQEKKDVYGDLLVSFALQAKKGRVEDESQQIDVTSFGKEIISRFHEIYYAAEEPQVLVRLKQALEKLLQEFTDQVDLEIVSAVVVEKQGQSIGYFALLGHGKIYISRNGQLVPILTTDEEEIITASGYLQNQDLFVLGTSQFFTFVSQGSLKAVLNAGRVNQAAEALAPLIHGQEDNAQAAAIVFQMAMTQEAVESKIEESEVKPEATTSPPQPNFTKPKSQPSKLKENLNNVFTLIKGLPFLTWKVIKDVKAQPNVFIQDQKRKVRAKKTTLTVAVVLIVLLLVSIILGSRKKTFLKDSAAISQVLDEANYKYEQAASLQELNPLRARSLLSEAKEQVQNLAAQVENKNEQEQLEQMLLKLEAELERVAREYKLDSAELFLDLTLAKEGFMGADWDASEGILQILDPDKSTVLEVAVESKKTKVAAGGEKIQGAFLIGVVEDRLFTLAKDKLVVVNSQTGEAIDEQENKDWGEIKDLVGFSQNAYLLASQKGQIFKLGGTDKGLAEANNYLTAAKLDLVDTVSMAIDGSVWVLFNDGTVVKFTRGVKDPFAISGLTQDLNQPEKIYTDPELEALYILDRQNTRVVVVNKATGEYQAQYIWPGIAGVKDLYASETEGKIFLLTGERIYEIELKP